MTQNITKAREFLNGKARYYMPTGERQTLLANLNGEEGAGIADIVLAVAKTIGELMTPSAREIFESA